MRKAEILGLRWREIRNGQIYLPGERTKNGKPREIPVSDTLAEELPRIEAAQGGERVVTMANLLFSTPRERKRRPNGILRIVDGPMRDIRVAWETAEKRARSPVIRRWRGPTTALSWRSWGTLNVDTIGAITGG